MNDYTINYMNSVDSQNVTNAKESIATYAAIGQVSTIFYIVIVFLMIVSMWKIFVKAGKAGWASLVPIYNTIVMLEIVKLPVWYILLMFVPIVNVIIGVVVMAKMAKAFGKGTGFVLGMLFLPLIFYPILAFDKSEYVWKF